MKKLLVGMIFGFFLFQGVLLGVPADLTAADFPSKNLSWYVGYSPGGGFDTYSRALAKYMQKYLPDKVNIVILNRPGAASQEAAATVYNAEPDGHTLGIWPMPGLYVPQVFFSPKYDVKKVTWFGTVLVEPMVLAVSPKSPYRTVKDLQQAENVRVTLTGFSGPEVAVPITMETLGIKAQFITGHKGSGEAMLAAVRGDGDAVVYTLGSIRKLLISKQLLPVLLMGNKSRDPEFPDMPTATEAGYPELDEAVAAWRVIGGPPNMPQDRVKFMRDLLWKTMNDKDFKEWSEKSKREISPMTGEQTDTALVKVLKLYDDYKPLFEKYMK